MRVGNINQNISKAITGQQLLERSLRTRAYESESICMTEASTA